MKNIFVKSATNFQAGQKSDPFQWKLQS